MASSCKTIHQFSKLFLITRNINLKCIRYNSVLTNIRPLHYISSSLRPGLCEIHTSCCHQKYLDPRQEDEDERDYRLTLQQSEIFEQVARANKVKNSATFKMALAKFASQEPVYRRGHVEFIYAAVKLMKDFNVDKDITAYKLLLDLFPKGKMVAKTMWQVEMMHYPKQQQCCIDLLDHMETNGVIPDDSMGAQLVEIFGKRTHAFRKYQRMMYWMPKFRYSNPYYVPHKLPDNDIELAVMALKRMAVDLQNKVQVFHASDLDSSVDPTFIVSAQSPVQRELLIDHPSEQAVYVEGGFHTWLRGQKLLYFILRSETTENYRQFEEGKNENDDETNFSWNMFQEERPKSLLVPPSVHEQSDGTILAMCITGTGSKDSLASWIKFLEQENPRLAQIPVVFLLRTPESGIVEIKDNNNGSNELETT